MSSRRTPQQAACIPFRGHGQDLRVCLIRRQGAKNWGIPKGLVDPGETPEQTALKEAWEEAGIRGQLLGAKLGTYDYEKWDTVLTVAVYLLEVHAEADAWEESSWRERRWLTWDEAASLLSEHPVHPLLADARAQLAE